ncbi:MAG: hypothetical protein L0Z62_10905 [Gemmataceae bacterium]|nr:hypothetical protein [Gemmataceae bacterium]
MAKRPPLCVRLYFEAHLVDVVRLIGYEELPVPVARERLAPLVQKYGKDRINAAIKELFEVDQSQDPPRARLAQPVREAAWRMLGPPPALAPEKTDAS